jgi:hypothetical protein
LLILAIVITKRERLTTKGKAPVEWSIGLWEAAGLQREPISGKLGVHSTRREASAWINMEESLVRTIQYVY